VDVTSVDSSAVLGRSALHRASPAGKIAATALLIATVVVAGDPLLVLGVALALLGGAAALGLPVRQMLPLALYPAVFALVFAFAAAPGPLSGALIVLKAVTAALAVVTLMFTTPYPQVFAPIQRVTPVIVGDALLMTYRSLFILARKFGDLARAVRLRAGVSARQPVRSAQATTRALGGLLLYSFDLSQREYDVLRLRGYEGRLRVTPQRSEDRRIDAAAIVFGAGALSLAIVVRALPSTAPYTWLVGVLGLVVALTGPFISRRAS
jgi:energy-coupling factor transporter transmembrane protein EcfT